MTETQERFLRTVLTRVPLESVVEMHLFPPIRRGTLETGVAVIATVLPPAPMLVVTESEEVVADLLEPESDDVPGDAVEAAAVLESAEVLESEEVRQADASDDADVAMESAEPVATMASEETEDEAAASLDDAPVALDADASVADGDEASPYAADAEPIDEPVALPHVEPRLRILTASYRATIKGVERGKWTVDVQEEADAPRDAVEAVLRGVRHRSTEPADPELVSHDVLSALIAPVTVAPAA